MTDKRYSTLDETSLRNLLDGTVDLDERRLIRSAIRELRRREIEDMEAALRSKRFRPATPHRHDDKENQHRSDAADSLDLLSGKLQAIHNVDELTGLLRGASDFEERKLIRAAIRRLRDEEIQGAQEKVKPASRHVEPLQEPPQSSNPHSSLTGDSERASLDEREHIKTLHSQSQSRELHRTGSNSGMVLVLDPMVRDKVSAPLAARLQHDSDSGSPDAVPPFRLRSDSEASDRSLGSSSHRARLDSGSRPCSRPRLASGASDASLGAPPSGWLPGDEPGTSGTPSSTDSEAETNNRNRAPVGEERPAIEADGEKPNGAALSRKDPGSVDCLLNGSSGRPKDRIQEQKVTLSRDTPLSSLSNGKDTELAYRPFNRASSVRDRMRKFTEPAPPAAGPAQRRGSQKNVRSGPTPVAAAPQPAPAPSERAAASREGTASLFSSSSSSSLSSASSPCEAKSLPGGVAARPLSQLGGPWRAAERVVRAAGGPGEGRALGRAAAAAAAAQQQSQESDSSMKTFLTIEIKDGRTAQTSAASRSSSAASVSASAAAGQRAELMMGLRATPFKISTSSHSSASSIKMETEPVVVVEPSVQTASEAPAVPNGSSATEAKAKERGSKLNSDQLYTIEDEELLDRMLDDSKDFEERKMIRAALRELRKKKREAVLHSGCSQEEIDQREKEREVRLQELRQQREERAQKGRPGGGAGEMVMKKVEKSADGTTVSQVTKTNRFAKSDDCSRSTHSSIMEASYVQKTDWGTVQSKSYSYSSSSSSSTKKAGSVFDREDDGVAAMERRQAERKKELARAQTLPKTSATQSRRAMIEKLEKDSGGPGNPAVAHVNKVQRSTSFGVPNANSIKQMLLDWCRAKTRSYENINIQNFSSSWSDGMAFCALVHNFFPQAFDFSALSPSNRRHNFEVAFSTAEKLADCPQLLDVEDMVRMREPDWKCVYTYLQEFYRGLVQAGLVKTKNSS